MLREKGHALDAADNHGVARLAKVEGNIVAALGSVALAVLVEPRGSFQDVKQGFFSHRRDCCSSYRFRQGLFFLLLACLFPTRLAEAQVAGSHTAAPFRANPGPEPPRYIVTLCPGGSLRMAKNADFGQKWLGPAFVDGFGGYVLPGTGPLRHGIGLNISWNLTADGGFTEPVYPGRQWAVTPSYLAFLNPNRDLMFLGHLGPTFAIADGGKTWGVEAAAGAGYRFLAGFGAYGELSLDLFFGANSTLHPISSLELGLFVDYEVLP